ncbi:MAG: DUF1800 family protein, partial [Deltaproteobacteria bacterium]|nr:DUF1800 family protein [Deltaproteobacteria bacterium]
TLTSERRFGFNKALWDRTGTQEEEIFRNGVKLFQGTAWELRDDMVQNGLNINSFSHIFSSNNQGIPQNPSFWSGGPHFIYDNVTSHLLLNHRRIPAAGSTASRALAIQLLGYFVGPKAARNPILVAELAEKIWEEGFNLKEPLKMLLKSEAIFSPEHVETVVKTPFEFALKIGRTLKIPQQYLYRLAQNWIVTTNFLNQISSWTGFDNLNMPSVFGVPIAGVQRNMGIFDGRAFISPVNTVLRRRRVSMLQRNIFQLYTRGAYLPNLSRQIQITDESSSGQITFPSVYFNQDDAFGDDGTWWSDISYLVFGEHYSYNPTNFPWQKYSGNIFYHYENLSNEFNNIDDIDEILNETLLRLGTPLSNTQKELARKYLTRLHPQEERPCWNNFVTTTVTINGVPVTMTALEAKRRYFDMKYIGMVYALLMTPDAWIK